MSDDGGAIAALAKLGERGLETLEKAGGWVDGVVGDGFRELGGTWADNVAGFRFRNRINVFKRAQEDLEKAGLRGNARQIPGRIAVPLIEALSDESDETLQGVWAAYIRNAVDPQKPNPDRLLIDVIRRLEPVDWPVLQTLFKSGQETLAADAFGMTDDQLSPVLDRLTTVGLLEYDDDRSAYLVMSQPGRMLTITCGGAKYFENRLLRALAAATAT